jgi:hypothetical protein
MVDDGMGVEIETAYAGPMYGRAVSRARGAAPTGEAPVPAVASRAAATVTKSFFTPLLPVLG